MAKDNENSIISINEQGEIEKRSTVRATRLRVAGANQFGKPMVRELGTFDFTTLTEALLWTSEAPEYAHYFAIPIDLNLTGELFGARIPRHELLAIRQGDHPWGESPRMVDGHHSVSADPDTREIYTININLGLDQLALFDRGHAWVSLDSPNILSFSINAGLHTPDELRDGLIRMVSRTNQVMNDLLHGMKEEMRGL